jgi:hypothetical protein
MSAVGFPFVPALGSAYSIIDLCTYYIPSLDNTHSFDKSCVDEPAVHRRSLARLTRSESVSEDLLLGTMGWDRISLAC